MSTTDKKKRYSIEKTSNVNIRILTQRSSGNVNLCFVFFTVNYKISYFSLSKAVHLTVFYLKCPKIYYSFSLK